MYSLPVDDYLKTGGASESMMRNNQQWARKKKQPDFPWNPGLFNRDPYFMVSENPHITG